MKNSEAIVSLLNVLEKNKLTQFNAHASALPEALHPEAAQIILALDNMNAKLLTKPVMTNLLRLLASPNAQENVTRLLEMVQAIGKLEKKNEIIQRIFLGLSYFEQIYPAFKHRALFLEHFDLITKKPEHAKDIAEALNKLNINNVPSKAYMKYMSEDPSNIINIADALILIEKRPTHALHEPEYIDMMMKYPQDALTLAKGWLALRGAKSELNKDWQWPTIVLERTLIPCRQYSDAIADHYISLLKSYKDDDTIFVEFIITAFRNKISIKSLPIEDVRKLELLDIDFAWCILGLVYAGKISVDGVGAERDHDKACQYLRYIDDQRSPWYIPAQAALFDALFENAESEPNQDALKNELLEIGNYLIDKNYTDFTGADMTKASSSTLACLPSNSPLLFKYDVSATRIEKGNKRSVGCTANIPF